MMAEKIEKKRTPKTLRLRLSIRNIATTAEEAHGYLGRAAVGAFGSGSAAVTIATGGFQQSVFLFSRNFSPGYPQRVLRAKELLLSQTGRNCMAIIGENNDIKNFGKPDL
jgi:hypothetical protein